MGLVRHDTRVSHSAVEHDARSPNHTPWVTVLADANPIAQGTVRQIWDRPDHPDQILKTIQPAKVQKFANRTAIQRAFDDFRYGPYRSFRVESRFYSKTTYKCLKAGLPNPIAEMGGLIVTDRGLAQVCEKITDSSGGLAKTLKDLTQDKALDTHQIQWLNDFVKTLFVLSVSVPDLSAANIVFDGVKNRFVLIDGYGDKAKIPLRTWFKCLNRQKLNARITRKIAVPGYLEWDASRRKFSLV